MTSEPLTIPTTPFEFQPRKPSLTNRRLFGAVMLGHLCGALSLPLLIALMFMPFQAITLYWSGLHFPMAGRYLSHLPEAAIGGGLFFFTGAALGLVEVWSAGGWIRRKWRFVITSGMAMVLLIPAQWYLLRKVPHFFPFFYPPSSALMLVYFAVMMAALGMLIGLGLGLIQSFWLTSRRAAWVVMTAAAWGLSSAILLSLYAAIMVAMD